MKRLGKTIAHIPARAGSKRVKAKNLRMLCGKPLLAYAIECAKACNTFDDIFVNSDSDEMLELACSMGVKAYKRDESLATDAVQGDEFTADFIESIKPDTLVMISPVCPLVTCQNVIEAIKAFEESDCDTLITCESTKMQAFCNNEPVNITLDGMLAPTQINPDVKILNWAVTVWDALKYMKNYKERGSAYIGKDRLLFPIDPVNGIKISNEADFHLAECIIHGMNNSSQQKVSAEYWVQEYA